MKVVERLLIVGILAPCLLGANEGVHEMVNVTKIKLPPTKNVPSPLQATKNNSDAEAETELSTPAVAPRANANANAERCAAQIADCDESSEHEKKTNATCNLASVYCHFKGACEDLANRTTIDCLERFKNCTNHVQMHARCMEDIVYDNGAGGHSVAPKLMTNLILAMLAYLYWLHR